MRGTIRQLMLWGAAAGILATAAAPAMADDDLIMKNKVDEEVRFRPSTGLSKARTLGQSDIDKKIKGGAGIFSSLKLHTTLRASYDAVYDLNSEKYGDSAGGSVAFWGTPAPGPFGAQNVAGNPNQGLELVNPWRGRDGGLQFATPVRPCDVDSRGCIKDYLDKSKNELAAPEFNDRLDFLRELYVDGEIPVGNSTLALRVGRQQLVWGRTDLFRVLDVVNPVDYSRNNIYDELQDIRIPMGMVRADYRMGARGPFDDLNVQGVWVVEQFRPNELGQGGSPNSALGAGRIFRAYKTCWDVGCTVGNFGALGDTQFAPGIVGIRNANMPDWNLSNTSVGGKVEGELKGVGFSLNALTTHSQMPSLRGINPSYLPAFDIEFPRLNIFGGSLDFTSDPIDTTFRFETAYTQGEEFANTARARLYSKNDVVRYVLGADRNTFIPFLNERRAFLFSGQVFGQHIFNHELRDGTAGPIGMPDWEDNWVATLLIKGWYMGDTVSPQVVMARDIRARANVVEPSVEWIPTARWRFRLGANVKFGEDRNSFDNDSGALPGVVSTGAFRGAEPLGMFRTGVIGMAHDETEIFANATLRF
ncbi:MAG: DUF1302 family protein [Solirubrobacterales bacterium]